ncbi:MAG: asparagine synthase (glutamine-hydrolyzing), partial [Rhodothermales bacterium]|nr:asparagine synthase (glutamine-hydrolyzing) [Rhodothermales bacterium]
MHFDGSPPSTSTLARMTHSLKHRGPDGEGTHIDGAVGLGHRRLAIIDTTEAGAQPMSNEDGSVWITYNGEIYNYAELRTDLQKRGHVFKSRSDTEVILHAYETWGVESLSRFNGIFSFAIWDSRQRSLWLVRDRLGVKPLFYLMRHDRVLLASEIKALLQDPSVDRSIDFTGLHHYLSLNYVPAPFTLFSGVSQLLPGHYLLIGADGRLQDVSYWDVSYGTQRSVDERQLLEEFDSLLSEAVSRQMVSDVPLGAFLSGGVDSSAVVYWMS